MEISEVINNNLNSIYKFDQYPSLKHLKDRTKCIDSLRHLMNHMLSYSYPVWKRYYLFSVAYVREWCRNKLGISQSIETWQSHIVLLSDMGLISRVRVTDLTDTDDPVLNRIKQTAIEKSQQKGRFYRPQTLWSMPEYTSEVLEAANAVAKQYIDHHAAFSHISKTDVIRIRGQQIANKLYLDGRTIGYEEKDVSDAIIAAVQMKVEEKGYTTRREVEREVNINFFAGIDHSYLNEEEIQTFNKYKRAVTKLLNRFRYVLSESKYEYGQATKEEKIKYSLMKQVTNLETGEITEKPIDAPVWIIRKK